MTSSQEAKLNSDQIYLVDKLISTIQANLHIIYENDFSYLRNHDLDLLNHMYTNLKTIIDRIETKRLEIPDDAATDSFRVVQDTIALSKIRPRPWQIVDIDEFRAKQNEAYNEYLREKQEQEENPDDEDDLYTILSAEMDKWEAMLAESHMPEGNTRESITRAQSIARVAQSVRSRKKDKGKRALTATTLAPRKPLPNRPGTTLPSQQYPPIFGNTRSASLRRLTAMPVGTSSRQLTVPVGASSIQLTVPGRNNSRPIAPFLGPGGRQSTASSIRPPGPSGTSGGARRRKSSVRRRRSKSKKRSRSKSKKRKSLVKHRSSTRRRSKSRRRR